MNESNMWKQTDEEILQQIPEKLLTWYDQNARILPWREDPRPYRVWVSEIMLQQTRVEAVKPYFERFLKALPTVADLAKAPEEQLNRQSCISGNRSSPTRGICSGSTKQLNGGMTYVAQHFW